MAITSEEIHNQSFTVDRKGYDVDEVDVFLEHVAAEIDGLNAEIGNLLAQVEELQAQLQEPAFDEPMDMDAAFAEPALPAEDEIEEAEEVVVEEGMAADEKDERIAELERQLAEKDADASVIATALVTAQRSAKEVIERAEDEAKGIRDDAEADAADIIDRANAERAKIEEAIDELERAHKKTCESYSEALKAFIEDANKKLDDVEDELAKRDGKKRAHARFANPVQAPIHKPDMAGVTGAVAPSYVAPAAPADAAPVTAAPAPKPAVVEKDLSGFGDASDAFDLGDID